MGPFLFLEMFDKEVSGLGTTREGKEREPGWVAVGLAAGKTQSVFPEPPAALCAFRRAAPEKRRVGDNASILVGCGTG